MVRLFPLVHARIDALAQRTHPRSVMMTPARVLFMRNGATSYPTCA